MNDLSVEEGLKGDEKVIAEAKRRWKQCVDWESVARQRGRDDRKFAEGDTDNKYQWPDSVRSGREKSQRPCLTINKTRQHNLHIINDAKQNTPSIKIIPTGGDSTYQSAQIYEGVIRHIEYISNSAAAYDNATEFQVKSGIGYWRVVTDYATPDDFDQEILIQPINDPDNVYLDPDIIQKDGSDARYAFIFVDMSKEEFQATYPKYKDYASNSSLGDTTTTQDEYHVRLVEYFRAVPKKDRIVAYVDPETGMRTVERESKIREKYQELADHVIDNPQTKMRDIVDTEIEWRLIVGETVLEKQVWPGRYIPVIRVIGEETVIDGQMDRKGHTRALKDQQRIYNYAASSSVEFVALQSKSPYIASVASIENLGEYYDSANTDNYSVLPYNHMDDDGNELAPPKKADIPVASPAFIQLMQDAHQQMDMASGQYEATFGERSNERSGVAINARQRQGDKATYHFIDNLALAIRFTGKILLDLIPKIYDTQRIIRILAEDGSSAEVMIDPEMQQVYAQRMNRRTQEVQHIFNPSVGNYDVMCDVEPGYATKREEAFNALTNIIERNPNAFMLFGDLWAKNADFAEADKIAERIQNMLPPAAKGEGVDPNIQQMQQQLQKAQQINGKLLQSLSESKLKEKDYSEENSIKAYDAETKRMAVEGEILSKHVVTPRLEAEMLHKMAVQEHQGGLNTRKDTYEDK